MVILHEYAVDPNLFSDKSAVRRVLDDTGYSRARLIARCPNDWTARAFQAAERCPFPIQRAYIRERLIRGRRRKVAQRKLPQCPEAVGLPWLEGAEVRYDSSQPFRAIVAARNERGHPAVLVVEELDEETPQWNVRIDARIERSARALAECIAPVILNAKRLVIVDPYFAPTKPGFREPLWELLSVARQRAAALSCVELHISERAYRHDNPHGDFRDECLRNQADFIPDGLTVECFRWEQLLFHDELHDRYVLTDMGGVQIGAGLAEVAPGATTRVSLLSDEDHQHLTTAFNRSTTTFKLVDSVSLPLSIAEVGA
jgi:hypothetical protein